MKEDYSALHELDRELMQLLLKRAALADSLRESGHGEELWNRENEEEHLRESARMTEDPLLREALQETMFQVRTVARKRGMAEDWAKAQTKAAGTDASEKEKTGMADLSGSEEEGHFLPVRFLDTCGAKIVFQGVEGAYSHQAMRQFFGREADASAVPSFEAAAAAVEAGEADFAVLPIENTTGGAVGDVLDLMMKYHCYTVAELDLPIRHVLLGLPGAALSDIDTVYSHPQGLLQCSDFLEQHRDWARIPFSNTAASAKKLVADGNPHHAAIASELCGELYGLTALKTGISNNRNNTTRFIIVTNRRIYREEAAKIRICFECRHETGALYRILSNFTFNSVNMTKIESRPIPGRQFEYRFFVDFEGNLRDANVRCALWGIRHETSVCRILGCF